MRNSLVVALRNVLLALAVTTLPSGVVAPAASGEVYKIDQRHTEIRFTWNHMGLSNQSGRFLDYAGTLTFDEASPEKSSLEVTIEAASLSTDVEGLDKKLRGADFFDVATHPKITFRSTKAIQTGTSSGRVTGDLTMKGVTRPVTFDVRLNYVGDHPLGLTSENYKGAKVAGFSVRGQILRSEFGLGKYAPVTSDAIEISIETEMLQRP